MDNGFDLPETEATADVASVKKLPRKASGLLCGPPVPQTDTGIHDEYSQARGLNLSKELGKLAPYLR